MALRNELVTFIQDTLARGQELEIQNDDRLLDLGIIDSMGLMQLIGFIEERTGLRVPDNEVVRDNFQTVESMEEMIERLRARV